MQELEQRLKDRHIQDMQAQMAAHKASVESLKEQAETLKLSELKALREVLDKEKGRAKTCTNNFLRFQKKKPNKLKSGIKKLYEVACKISIVHCKKILLLKINLLECEITQNCLCSAHACPYSLGFAKHP